MPLYAELITYICVQLPRTFSIHEHNLTRATRIGYSLAVTMVVQGAVPGGSMGHQQCSVQELQSRNHCGQSQVIQRPSKIQTWYAVAHMCWLTFLPQRVARLFAVVACVSTSSDVPYMRTLKVLRHRLPWYQRTKTHSKKVEQGRVELRDIS